MQPDTLMNEDSKSEQATTGQSNSEMENRNGVTIQEEVEAPATNSEESSTTDEPKPAEQQLPEDVEPTEVDGEESTPSELSEEEQADPVEEEASESDTDDEPSEVDTDDESSEVDTDDESSEVDTDDESSEVDTDDESSEAETSEAEPVSEADSVPSADETTDTDIEISDVMTQESLEEAYDNSLRAFAEGEIVKGKVVEVSSDEVMIDIGFKSEGYIQASEFEVGEDGLPSVQVGDQIDVYIVRREDADGQIVLSKEIADRTRVWDEITEAYEEGRTVQGEIVERIKGGLRVNVGTLRAFLPASQIELRPVQDFDRYVGMTLDMKIVKVSSKRRRNIVLSRRLLLEEEAIARKSELLSQLEVDQVRAGVVKNITSFGAFVDLGGIDGLLHKTDMSWGKVNHPSEVVSIDEEVEVIVIGVDPEKEQVSLGIKQRTTDPWLNIEEKYPIGSTVHGKIVNIVNYGAFLELEEGVEGLIHVSEMSWTRRNVAPSKIVTKSDDIDAVVLDIDRGHKRISLGLKQLHANPWELLEQKYPIGTKIVGHVRNLTDFGAFVEIEAGIDGLIHTSDLSWVKRDAHPRDFLKEGDEVEVMVLEIDPAERKVSLGLKQIEPDPWQQVPEKYKIGSVARGEIMNLTNFGAFAKLEDGIEGLIHISELAERRIEKPEEIVNIGDQLDLKIIHLDPNERRIGLSLKAAVVEQERATTAQYQQRQSPEPQRPEPEQPKQEEEPTTTLGALLKEELKKSES
jgi:small subunit ribosomal protein S1